MLDTQDLYKFLLKWDGFTYSMKDAQYYKGGKGFAVSTVNYEMKLNKNLLNPLMFNAIYRTYESVIGMSLAKNWYFGAWKDGDYFVFDVTEIELDRYTALYKGIERNQKSVYDFYAGESIILEHVDKKILDMLMREKGYEI